MSTNIKILQDLDNNTFYPKTHTQAIIDNNGTTLEDRLEGIEGNILPSGGTNGLILEKDDTQSTGAKWANRTQISVGTTTTGEPGTDANVTNSGTTANPVLNFTIPRGTNGHNPCLGVFADASSLPTTDVQEGDYAYADVTDSTTQTTASHIFRYDGSEWQDNGEGSPNNQTKFDGGNGPAVGSMKIDDTKLVNPAPNALAKAADVKKVAKAIKIVGFGRTGADAGVTEVGQYYVKNNETPNVLRYKARDTGSNDYDNIPWYDGAIYTYSGELYIFNGEQLIRVTDYTYKNVFAYGATFTGNSVTINNIQLLTSDGGAWITISVNQTFTFQDEVRNYLILHTDGNYSVELITDFGPSYSGVKYTDIILLYRSGSKKFEGGALLPLYNEMIKENIASKVNSWQTIPDNSHYPSEKLVKYTIDALQAKEEKDISVLNKKVGNGIINTVVLENQGTAYKNVYCGDDTTIGKKGEIVDSPSVNSCAATIPLSSQTAVVRFYAYKWSGDFGWAIFNADDELVASGIYNQMIQNNKWIDLIVSEYVSDGCYINLSLRNPIDVNSRDVTITEIFDLSTCFDNLSKEIKEINIKYKHYNTIGSPSVFSLPASIDTTGLSIPTTTADLYALYDSLCSQHPNFIRRENDLGTDSSGSYTIRKYTVGFQNQVISESDEMQGENLWDDAIYKYRRLLLVGGVHGTERAAAYGVYLACKEIIEAADDATRFIRANFIIDVVPCENPWGYNNNERYNYNNRNLNRDYNITEKQVETTYMIDLITDLKSKGLIGVVDCHNCNYTGGGFITAKPALPRYNFYVMLAQQMHAALCEALNSAYGSVGNHLFLWNSTNDGTLFWYANTNGLLGCTFEISNSFSRISSGNTNETGSVLTKGEAINAIAAFGMYEGE